MKTLMTVVLGLALLASAPSKAGEDRLVRLADLSAAEVQAVVGGKLPNVTIEFRKGDRLPVKLDVQGDLVESDDSTATSLAVKTMFYVKVKKNKFYMSLDGHDFDPIKDLVGGNLGVGVTGSPASEIKVSLDAYLKTKN